MCSPTPLTSIPRWANIPINLHDTDSSHRRRRVLDSLLCGRLLAAGNEVLGLGDLFTGLCLNIDELLDNRRFELMWHDVIWCMLVPSMDSPTHSGYIDPWDHEALDYRGLSDRDGVLVKPDGSGYPVRGGVARFIGRDPLDDWILKCIGVVRATEGPTQSQASVESFGFQWNWDSNPRTEEDLLWRVATRFGLDPAVFSDKRVLDAGCGAGAQSEFLAKAGAQVSAVDLSSAIDVAARRPELRDARLAQGDLAHLPFANAAFDIVYCEGVLQHTAATEPILAEFSRVLVPGGMLLATHYLRPEGVLRTACWVAHEGLRSLAKRLPREWLFLASGVAAAAALVPGLGWPLRKTLVPTNVRMPTLKATWSNVYDSYGQHEFQRHLRLDEYFGAVRAAGFTSVEQPGAEVAPWRKKFDGDRTP